MLLTLEHYWCHAASYANVQTTKQIGGTELHLDPSLPKTNN